MRRWGRAPICKDFRLNHRLGIQTACNIVEKGNKGGCGGKRKACEECREERLSSQVQEITKG
jgi:hypothetical protein